MRSMLGVVEMKLRNIVIFVSRGETYGLNFKRNARARYLG